MADLLDRRQAVEARHQRILKGRWYRERGQRPVESIAVGVLDQDVPFKHRLCELLDEQRVAVGLGDNLVHHFGRQGAAAGHLRDYAFNVIAIEATERQRADIGETNPGRFEFRPRGEQGKNRQLAHPLDSQIE
ncbi:MAG: hypothetical protein WCF47_23330 [Pseudolabrys sp.]